MKLEKNTFLGMLFTTMFSIKKSKFMSYVEIDK